MGFVSDESYFMADKNGGANRSPLLMFSTKSRPPNVLCFLISVENSYFHIIPVKILEERLNSGCSAEQFTFSRLPSLSHGPDFINPLLGQLNQPNTSIQAWELGEVRPENETILFIFCFLQHFLQS